MSELVHRRFKFPSRCNCETVVLRETNGIDEQHAALQAEARGERSSIYQELVRLAIVEVDGQKVVQPFALLEQWNSRTRALVQTAYQKLNDLDESEIGAFLGSGMDANEDADIQKGEQQEDEVQQKRRSKGTGK